MDLTSFGRNGKGSIMLEMARARSASKKATKLIGHERYSEAAFTFERARELYRAAGNFEQAGIACIEARSAMKLARKKSQSNAAAPPSSEMQARIIEKWNAKIRQITVHESDLMTLTVDKERKMGRKAKA
jgi:hypothetical protein